MRINKTVEIVVPGGSPSDIIAALTDCGLPEKAVLFDVESENFELEVGRVRTLTRLFFEWSDEE